MNFAEYQSLSQNTAIYPRRTKAGALSYVGLKVAGEAGEVSENIGKMLRDDNEELTEARKEKLLKEAGDVLWYLAALARELDTTLEDIAMRNIAKLHDRQQRGVLHGSGDNR